MPWVTHVSPEVDKSSQYPAFIAVSLTLTTLMTIFVVLRTYVRAAIVRSLGNDDYVIFVSAVISIVYNGLAVWQTRLGLGLPLSLRPEADLAKYSVVNFAGRPLYMIVITGYKIAVCLGYLRLLGVAMPIMQRVVKSVLVFVIVSHIADTLVIVLQCLPVAKSWNSSVPGHCLSNYPTWNATAAITIVCDITIFLLPIPLFANLQVGIRRKISLIVVFILGIFTTLCSIMRMVQIRQVAKDGNNSTLVLWGTVEMNVGIILSCVPALLPLVRTWLPSSRDYLNSKEQTYRTRSSGIVQLRTLSAQPSNDEVAKASRSARDDDAGSEDDILPLHALTSEYNPHAIRKTVDVQVTRTEGTTGRHMVAFPSPRTTPRDQSLY